MGNFSTSKFESSPVGRLLVLMVLAGAAGLALAALFIIQPQDLSDIGGYGQTAASGPAREIKAVLQSSIERGYPLTLTETEINQWLGRTLVAKQGGLLADCVSLERVLVRLEDGRAEVVMLRKVLGQPFTVSLFLKVEQFQGTKGVVTEVQLHGGPYDPNFPQPPRGGRFGKLVVPQGFMLLVMPAYEQLAALFHDEIRLAFEEMARITIEKHRLILNPREPSEVPSGLPQTF